VRDYPIKVGSMLFTMVEPRRGHEVDYNRWYERDHFYAGCMIGAGCFSGRRFVATRALKELRYPEETPMTPDRSTGSYLAVYWILEGMHDDWNRWAVQQVNWLHANGRMFAERDHIHTLLYRYAWDVLREAEAIPLALALDHPFAGLVVTVADAAPGVGREGLTAWYREQCLPQVMGGGAHSPVALCAAWHPLPLLGEAPSDVPRTAANEERLLLLWFLATEPAAVWDALFSKHGAELDASGAGRLVWAGPFIPTIPGTDTYTDQLW